MRCGGATDADAVLSVRQLRVDFHTAAGSVQAVDQVSFDLRPRETLGVVGESGSGKSATALAIMGLVPTPPASLDGEIVFRGANLLALDAEAMRSIRGRHIAMIFQDPMSSLNPALRIGFQVSEGARLHLGLDRPAADELAVTLLRQVGLAEPERQAARYPHELSGGMRQRVMIAMALACKPEIVIADEPTTALDVTTQAMILETLSELRSELGVALLLITHDFGVIAQWTDRVVVMYAGEVVEIGPTDEVLAAPLHPYTLALLKAIPEAVAGSRADHPLAAIPGVVPSLLGRPPGCPFEPRCGSALPKCRTLSPPPGPAGPARLVRCWLHQP